MFSNVWQGFGRFVLGLSIVCVAGSGFCESQASPSGKEIAEKKTSPKPELATAVFAGGCFWCMEPPFDELKGVFSTTSGFAGGKKANPRYSEVASGKTNHVEAVKVEYDPAVVSYRRLVDVYWRQIDPTDGSGSFVDRGPHYRPVIYYKNEKEKSVIAASLEKLKARKLYKKKIVVEISPFTSFYPAEDYHQDYYKKNPIRYKYYRYRSGRDQYLESIWKGKGI